MIEHWFRRRSNLGGYYRLYWDGEQYELVDEDDDNDIRHYVIDNYGLMVPIYYTPKQLGLE